MNSSNAEDSSNSITEWVAEGFTILGGAFLYWVILEITLLRVLYSDTDPSYSAFVVVLVMDLS